MLTRPLVRFVALTVYAGASVAGAWYVYRDAAGRDIGATGQRWAALTLCLGPAAVLAVAYYRLWLLEQ
ncbi:hypothetical protein J2752_002364 [Halarchaeum rubridurum]|uniref:Uncharacterized protein n=1 Tax=Halarchaeum rubridurum TaxID=489911 RepID=A0A830G2F7_9EURY|nr:hypothetical protein [Halarchaeum rubridurum]MBP1955441.1 hypothetical protein [Halarchaeum rubridurum]GGM72392.1 hypothetical protein GCM10009017_22940 [Halarchaeum rubridurum]